MAQVTAAHGHAPFPIPPALLRTPGPWKFLFVVAAVSAGTVPVLIAVVPRLKPSPTEMLAVLLGFFGVGFGTFLWLARGPKGKPSEPPPVSGVTFRRMAQGVALLLPITLAILIVAILIQAKRRLPATPTAANRVPYPGEADIIFTPIGTSTDPAAIRATSPRRIQAGVQIRTVTLGDGSVHDLPEAEFLRRLTLGPTNQYPAVADYFLGSPMTGRAAQRRLEEGASIGMPENPADNLHVLGLDLSEAFRQLSQGRPALAMDTLHVLCRVLPYDPDRQYAFGLDSPERVGKMDLHLKAESRHGGFLALLAVLAARAEPPQPAILTWAQNQGRALWGDQPTLRVCERRLNGDSDQDWDEVFVATQTILALRPGQTVRFTVIRQSKTYGAVPRTNVVDFPWPRLP
jgi:hypothetical protein